MRKDRIQKAGMLALALAWAAVAFRAVQLVLGDAPPGKWLGLDIAMQCWSMCALALMGARGKIDLPGWGWCAAAAAALAFGDPLANHVHPWMMNQGLYPSFWGRGNDPQQSPQYARLLAWTIALGVAWLRMGAPKKLARDPMSTLALIGASSVLATSMLFHVASLWIVQDRQEELASQARLVMMASSDVAFMGYCAASGAMCGSGEAPVAAVIEAMPKLGVDQARASLLAVAGSGPGAFAFWRQATEAKSFNRLPSMAAAAGVGPAGELRLWVDVRSLARALALGERVFALLALCAHLTWMGGAMGLGWWHQKMMDRRRVLRADLGAH